MKRPVLRLRQTDLYLLLPLRFLLFNISNNYKMKVNVYQIGGQYGYNVWISEDSHKVLEINYEDPHSGGTIDKSTDGIIECDFTFLENAEPELYKEIMRVKNGEAHNKYRVINNSGVYGDFEKWELEYEHNKRIFLTQFAIIEKVANTRHSTLLF